MAVSASLYHTLCRELAAVAPAVRVTSRQRLAVFIVAIVASQSCVIAALARRDVEAAKDSLRNDLVDGTTAILNVLED